MPTRCPGGSLPDPENGGSKVNFLGDLNWMILIINNVG